MARRGIPGLRGSGVNSRSPMITLFTLDMRAKIAASVVTVTDTFELPRAILLASSWPL